VPPILAAPRDRLEWKAYQREMAEMARQGAAWRRTWRGIRRLCRFGWAHRRGLAPLYLAVAMEISGAVLSTAEKGYATVLAISTVLAPVLVRRLHRWPARFPWEPASKTPRKPVPRRQAVWVWTLFAAVTAWLTAAANTGAGPPMPGFLLIGFIVWSLGWWSHHRIRPRTADDPRVQLWGDYVACTDGPLPKAVLHDVLPITAAQYAAGAQAVGVTTGGGTSEPIGWTGTSSLPPGKNTATRAMAKVEDVASAFSLDAQSVVLEPVDPPRADRVKVSVYEHNPLRNVLPWPGPHLFDPETGIVPVALYQDGQHALYRYYRRGSGPVHDLIAGTTDAGKSRLLDMFLAIERHNWMVSFVIDPQEGASLPVWKDQPDGSRAVHGYARNVTEGLSLLKAIYAEMKARNRFMANYEWTDEKGRTRYGLDHFDPAFWATREDPADRLCLLCLTIDESHELLNEPSGQGKGRAEDIGKMARKCGIKLRLVTHVPTLDQLGGSGTLRDMVKSQVVVLRTGTPLVGQVAFSGRLPVDPVSIPIEFPDRSSTAGMGYILGPGARPAPVRTWLVEDATHWATTGSLTPFTPLSPELAAWMGGARGAGQRGAPVAVSQPPVGVPAPRTAKQQVAEYLRLRGTQVGRQVIVRELGIEATQVSRALRELGEEGLVHQPDCRPGMWAAGPGVESATEVPV
jgi:hypothetical protein